MAIQVSSEADLLDRFNVRLGEWTRDECSEYCPVICLGREEQPTLHDGEDPEVEAFRSVAAANPGPNILDDGYLARGRAGYSSTLGFGSLCHETIHQVLGENPELKLHDFGPRGPSALGVDGKPVEKKP